MSGALPCLVLSPCPLPAPGAPRIPLPKPPRFLPPIYRSPSSGLAPWSFVFLELHWLCALPEAHKVEGAEGWLLWEDSGVQSKARRQGWEKGSARILGQEPDFSSEKCRRGCKPGLSLQETPFVYLHSQQDFSQKIAHWWRSPLRTDLSAQHSDLCAAGTHPCPAQCSTPLLLPSCQSF